MEYKGQQLSSMKQAQKGEAGVGRIPKVISRGTLLHIRGCSFYLQILVTLELEMELTNSKHPLPVAAPG